MIAKIVIADDDARMRQMLRQIVSSLASAVYEAADGSEAVALCAVERPDWVLMDLRMKPMDGLRATTEISARFPKTRIAIVTQYDDLELRGEALRAGDCAYILKEEILKLPGVLLGELKNGGTNPDSSTLRQLNKTSAKPQTQEPLK